MPVVARPGVGLHYEVRGVGTTVLCIHGTPSSQAFWVDPAERLATRLRCVTYDRRGFGASVPATPAERIDLDEHVGDAVALLGHVAGGRAVALGRSTGGLIALALAERHPDLLLGVALLEPAVFSLDPGAASWARSVRAGVLAREARRPGSASRAVFDLALGEEVWPSLPAEARLLFESGSAGVVAEIHGKGLDLSLEPYEPDLTQVDLPVLVVTADDSYAAARRVDDALVAGLGNAVHVTVAGGHLIDPAGPAIFDFVERVSPGQHTDHGGA